jgi:hypothetical protein
MRLHFLLALVSLLALALAWTKEDYEIFDLVSDLEAAEGASSTTYVTGKIVLDSATD